MFTNSGRDSGRRPYSRGFHGGVRNSYTGRSVPPPLPPPKPSQKHLKTLSITEVKADEDHGLVRIKDCQYLASYNWLEGESAIIVPGSPPKWTPPISNSAIKLQPDQPNSANYFRDQNAARNPSFPFEAGVRSIFSLNPGFNGQEINIVACGSTIGSLLTFHKGLERTFRMGVEKVGNTVFLVRRENSPTQLIKDIVGYGQTFPEHFTTWDRTVRGSASHQRLVRYDLGALTCVIRVEIDGYLPDKQATKASHVAGGHDEKKTEVKEMSKLSVHTKAFKADTSASCQVKLGGLKIDQAAIFDLKTRSMSTANPIKMDEQLTRLWVSQVPHFVLAEHQRGLFVQNNIQIRDLTSEVKDWETRSQKLVRDLQATLLNLIGVADKQRNKKVEVRRSGADDELQLWSEDDEWSALPEDLRQKWMRVKSDR